MRDELSGVWDSQYWYENTKHDNREDVSKYRIVIERSGIEYTFHSLPNTGETKGSYIEGRLGADGPIITGIYQEDTAPEGEWMGMTYKGALQLLLADDGKHMEGMWVTTSYNNGNPKVSTNRWEMRRVPQTAA
jgi:hypothetical protein